MLQRIPKILVVDDESGVRNLIGDVLRMHGYPFHASENGPRALEHCETVGLPDLVVTDIMMPPYFNGVELVRRLRAQKPDLKVLYVSAHAGDPELEGVFRDAQADFLPKPLSPMVLCQRIERILEGTPPARGRDASRRRGTILLGLANAARRQWVRESLWAGGFWVLEAAHPGEARFLRESHEGSIDLVLSDPPRSGPRGTWFESPEGRRHGPEILFIDEDEEQIRLTPDIPRENIPELWEHVRQSLARAPA